MRLLVLGHTGMLGHIVKRYAELTGNQVMTLDSRWPSNEFKQQVLEAEVDLIIDCIGSIPQRSSDFDINRQLPIWLDQNTSVRIIHPGTDCEMDEDEYGKSKAAASVWLKANGVRTKILRTSIIGPELKGNYSLMGWFLNNPDGSTINGYTNHLWNGNTTLTWAKYALKLAKHWQDFGPETVICSECESKHYVLQQIAKVYDRQIEVKPFKAAKEVHHCLNGLFTHPIKVQLEELKRFCNED
jgi:dTDP-4-dehydrorhamnose reductase